MNSTEQTLRAKALSGTDAAAICGISPWKTPADVWVEKKHPDSVSKEIDPATAEMLRWGNLLEEPIANEYARQTGVTIFKPEPKLMVHPEFSWLIGSPDFLIKGKKCGLEVKTALEWSKSEWGPTGTDIIPMHYVFQCFHYMMLTGLKEWHVAVLIGAREFRIYQLFLHREAAIMLLETEQEFVNKYLIGDAQPPLDFGENVKQWIKNRFSKSADKTIVVSPYDDNKIKSMLMHHADVYDKFKFYEKEREASASKIQLFMQDCAYLEYPEEGVHIRWRTEKESFEVDWEAIARALMARPELAALPTEEKEKIFKDNTHKRKTKRPFNFSIKGSEG